jgi:hypothetical protein
MSTVTSPATARYVRPGTRGQDTEIIPFEADDGVPLTMLHVTRPGGDTPRGPVMLVHGAGVRAEIYRPPIEHTLVDALLDDGFDVWLLNWRSSIDLRPVAWTLDDAAAYDYPAAVRLILARTGAETLKAFVHCQGSTSFVISAISGLVPEVTTRNGADRRLRLAVELPGVGTRVTRGIDRLGVHPELRLAGAPGADPGRTRWPLAHRHGRAE